MELMFYWWRQTTKVSELYGILEGGKYNGKIKQGKKEKYNWGMNLQF